MRKNIAIIGGGPAGLTAAEIVSAAGVGVTLYERKPSVGRKFLMAGRGGLNLTHSEDLDTFIGRYGPASSLLAPIIQDFSPQNLRDWCEGLGEKTFVGSSGRVFPESFKASPLLRAWIARLENQGVGFKVQHDWRGWDGDALVFQTPKGQISVTADAALLALGGASWPRLGTDGSWVSILQKEELKVAALQPANCGFFVDWSDMFKDRFAGQPLKPVIARFNDRSAQGEIMISVHGVEGGAIYALSSLLRGHGGPVQLHLDLKPDLNMSIVVERLSKPRGRDSLSSHLRKVLHLSPVTIGLLMEHPDRQNLGSRHAGQMAQLIKNYPLSLKGPFPMESAISSAGGIQFSQLDENLMLRNKPGVFAAGEMLDWEAPTGGYLLQASIATGLRAAQGILKYL